MSLTSLADEAIMKTDQEFVRARLEPLVDAHLSKIGPKYALPPEVMEGLRADLLPLAAEHPLERTRGSNALDTLVRYIPTEAITLYVAAMAAMGPLKATFPVLTEARVFWFFVFLTPALFLLIFVGKRRSQNRPALPGQWPWWKMTASTIAFLVWALAIPTAPYLTGESGKVVAAFGAILVSTFLTLLEPVFEKGIAPRGNAGDAIAGG